MLWINTQGFNLAFTPLFEVIREVLSRFIAFSLKIFALARYCATQICRWNSVMVCLGCLCSWKSLPALCICLGNVWWSGCCPDLLWCASFSASSFLLCLLVCHLLLGGMKVYLVDPSILQQTLFGVHRTYLVHHLRVIWLGHNLVAVWQQFLSSSCLVSTR